MCMSPLKIYWDKVEHKFQFNSKNPDLWHYAIVPCGRCPDCKKKWRTQLAQRVRYELSKYSYNEVCFLTLTVNDDKLQEVFPNGSLDHGYFQKFMKRLRRRLEYHGFKGKIKYLVSGEYGEKEGRPHFHMIMFGYKPQDLKFFYKSKKGYNSYKSAFLEEVWGAGFVDVGDVDEHTAPYMVKYITKFGEVKQDDFIVNGKKVRKPYVVYPKKILGLDYFLSNYEQILNNGYVLDSKGKKVGIPRSYLKYCENTDNIAIQECYKLYKARCDLLIAESNRDLMNKYDLHYFDVYDWVLQQGKIRREIYDSFKNVNR